MIIAILQHTPVWVFALLAGLITLGISQSVDRSVTLRRTAVLPVALVSLSLLGVVGSFGSQPLALPAWAAGLASAVAALHGRIDISAVRFSAASRRFELPGSWLPLILMLVLFAIKFGAGVSLAMQPALRQSAAFALSASTAYGVFSGVFLARAMALWVLARRSRLQPA